MKESELEQVEWNRTGKILACQIDGCRMNSSGFVMIEDGDEGEFLFLCNRHHGIVLKAEMSKA